METETIVTLKSFLSKELGIIMGKNELTQRGIKTSEEFVLSVRIEKETLLEVLNKYFIMVDGSYNLIRPDNKFSLDFLYDIKNEKGLCLLSVVGVNDELWVKTTIFT